MTTFIDIHTLHTVPYSNLNRDDLGTPKQAVYGGVPRARLSSASIKRPARLLVEASLPDPAVRTRRLPAKVRDHLVSRGWAEEPALAATGHLAELITKLVNPKRTKIAGLAKNPERINVLLLLTESQIHAIADEVHQHKELYDSGKQKKSPWNKAADENRFVEILKKTDGTVALLGRFIAGLPDTKVDGAVQVAHAITTHRVDLEIDYFSAVDDLNAADDTGAGHVSTAEYTSGTFYKMASIDCDQLLRNLDGDIDTARILSRSFVDAFAMALPRGKATSTAANITVPDLVAVTVRHDRPVNLVSAFEQPVRGQNGFVDPSIAALDTYNQQISAFLGNEPAWAGYASPTHTATSLGERLTLNDLGDAAINHAFEEHKDLP